MRQEYKEVLEKIYTCYINIQSNPQRQYREEAAETLRTTIYELEKSNMRFEDIISNEDCSSVLMITSDGLEALKKFVTKFINAGYDDKEEMSDIADEQIRLGKWVKEHKKELVK